VAVLAGFIALVALIARLLRIEPIPDERPVPASVHAGPAAALSGDPALAASAVVPEPAVLPAGGAPAAGAGQAADRSKARQALPGAYWLAWTMMVMTGAVEIVLSLWTADVLREEISFTPAAASAAVSAILLGMLVGRAAGARVALRLRPMPLYFAALGLSLLGFVVFWLATTPGLAVAGLIIVGLGNAMHYPLAIAVALAVAPGQADRAAGVASYGMGLSFGVGPLMLGLLADEVGAHAALLLVPVFLAGAAALAWRLSRSADSPKLGDGPAEIVEQMA
jgi:fucose permease